VAERQVGPRGGRNSDANEDQESHEEEETPENIDENRSDINRDKGTTQ